MRKNKQTPYLVLAAFMGMSGWPAAAQDNLLDRAAELDAQGKCAEAEQLYLTAARSPALLNNLGNHYLVCDQPDKARATFLSLLKLNPNHTNANYQLARLAVADQDGSRALGLLAAIRNPDPEVLLVRAEALSQTGQREQAFAILSRLRNSASARNPEFQFALALTYARAGFYAQAEQAFGALQAAHPDDYELTFNLGLAAARAGHSEKAKSVFESILQTRSNDVSALYELGRVESSLRNFNRAILLLVQARKLAPQRPDIILALARTTQTAGFYGDAMIAYQDYLALKPDDDLVRRDWALLYGYSKDGREEGLKALAAYAEKHPSDAVGLYDLAQLVGRTDAPKAVEIALRALNLDPKLAAARYYLAWLLQQTDRFADSAAQLQTLLLRDPKNVNALDLLGQNYLYLNKPNEAEKYLRQASTLAPNEPAVLFHLGRALIEQGRSQEAQPLLARFQTLRKDASPVHWDEPGIIELAGLTPGERSLRAVEHLQNAVLDNPNDASFRLNLATVLLTLGRKEDALRQFRELHALNPPPEICHKAGAALLQSGEYALACEFLQSASGSAAQLDLAIARLQLDGPQAALAVLDQVDKKQDPGDYALLSAAILDAQGKASESLASLQESLHYPIARAGLAQQVALAWLRRKQTKPAFDLLTAALRQAPDDLQLALTRAVALSPLGQNVQALEAVRAIEKRSPEWDHPYIVEGLLLERAGMPGAPERIRIALGLGSTEPALKCGHQTPNCSCTSAIYEVFFPGCLPPK